MDSYKDYRLLGMLDAQDRILTSDSEDGFVPGEAASFIMLMADKAAQRLDKINLPCLYRPGLANEEAHLYSDQTYKGEGLSEAFQMALSQQNGQRINAVYSTFNGENFWANHF